jgi:predicted MFS family arabinose efflux permease
MYLLVSPLPRYVDELGGDPFVVGLAMGAFSITAVLSRPLSGKVVDSAGSKPMLIAGAANFGIASLLYLWTSSIPLFIANRLFNGLGISFFTTAYMAFIAGLASVSRRGEAMGIAFIAPGLALVISVTLGDAILNLMGFERIFITAAAAGFISMVLALLLRPPEIKVEFSGATRGFWPVLKQRAVWLSTLVSVVGAAAYGSVFTFMPLFVHGRGLDNVGYFFTAYAITFMLAMIPSGTLSDRIGRKWVIVPSMVGTALVFWLMAPANGAVWLLAAAALYGMMFSSGRLAMDAFLVDHVSPTARGTAMSIQYGGFDVGVGIGGFGMGLVAGAFGYPAMFALVGAVVLLSATLFAVMARDAERLI